MSSIKAEFDQQNMEKCTFHPKINRKSTKIAYKQLNELHMNQKEFEYTYMVDSNKEDHNTVLN